MENNKRKELDSVDVLEENTEKVSKTEIKDDDPFDGEEREFYMTKIFTQSSLPHLISEKPREMTEDEMRFIVSMVLSELTELVQTRYPKKEEALEFVKSCIGKDVHDHPTLDDPVDRIAAQADALTDAKVYADNMLCKLGINGHACYKEVMKANMKKGKRTPEGWKFEIRKEDNKVLKPADFVPPDMKSVIQKMM